jgi:cytochrome P450
MLSDTELFDPMTIDRGDRYKVFERFLASGPAHLGPGPFAAMPATLYIFSRSLVEKALTHRELLQAPEGPYSAVRGVLTKDSVFALLTQTMLFSDPPQHGHLRRPVASLFTATRLAELESEIAALARRHAERCFERKSFDLIQDFAAPYVVGVLSRILGLDIPDGNWLKARTARIADALDFRGDSSLEAANRACVELRDFVESRLGPRCDPASILAAMLALEKDGVWNHEDVVNSCVLFLFAGQETVIDAIGNSALALAQFPEASEELRGRPELCAAAAEELLRFDSPVQFTASRIAATDIVIDGIELAAGQSLVGVLGSANHDPAWCEQPRKLDFHRRGRSQLASFGGGIHICLGQHLARMELKSFLDVFYARPRATWHLRSDQAARRRNIVFRGVTCAPIVVGE